jgi:hypothetical protein
LSPTSFAQSLQGTHHRQANQAQPFKLTHAAINPQHQAVIEVFSKRAYPLPPATAATGRRSASTRKERLALRRKPQALGIGRVDALMDEHGHCSPSNAASLAIQQIQRRSQLIAAPTDFVNGQVQLTLKMLQLLPDGTATYAEGSPQRFSGMEPAILEEIQQLQHASLDLE